MKSIRIERDVHLPDTLRVNRALSAPHLGPRILFFSGGSALNGISRQLKQYTFNSVHLVTPFDSGGSSQVLREAFDMPAVGDLRSRLMALADETVLGQPDVYALFNHRLCKEGAQKDLRAEVDRIIAGKHPLVAVIAKPMRQLIQSLLSSFAEQVPKSFNYRNASIGNLILAGGYFSHGRALEPVLFLMSKMVDVRGTVQAIVDENLQLGVDLENGEQIIGQRLISGKEAPPIESPIKRCFLSNGTAEVSAADVPLPKRNRKLIEQADVICYPPGSLYSSVVVNLLPAGVGKAIARRRVPKIYLPAVGTDPEAIGHSLADQVAAIAKPLQADAGHGVAINQFITHVLCDTSCPSAQCEEVEDKYGTPCHRMTLAQSKQARYDPAEVVRVLISFG